MPGTVFVTGGAGYIGSHCCRAFAQAGWTVVTYDNLSCGWRDFVKWGPLIEGDVLDTRALESAVLAVKPDIVAHFAGLANVGESLERPDLYYRANCAGVLAILNAMRGARVTRLLFSSTCAIYGSPARLPIDETHPLGPINPYSWSKLFAERMILDYASTFGLRTLTLRYFNAAGADPDGAIGERHRPETHTIPLVMSSALTGAPFQVFGNDFDTRDGTPIRDYVHVVDLGEAHLRGLAYLCDGEGSNAFNLGTSEGITVLELIRAVERISGQRVSYDLTARRAGDPAILVATSQRAREALGWHPTHSNIDTIVRTAWRWHASEAGAQN